MPPLAAIDSGSLDVGFTVAVIGAGPQGAELAALSLAAGFRTVVEDVFPERLRSLTQMLEQQMDTGLLRERLVYASTVEEAVRQADFALDFVPDELESKLEIFSLLDRMAPPRTILCSPMVGTSISDLQACTYRADRCVAIRKPAGESWRSTPSITLLRGVGTSDATLATAEAVWQRMGKQVAMELEQVAVPAQ